MPAVVVSAAVARRSHEERHKVVPILVNPFKIRRQQRTLEQYAAGEVATGSIAPATSGEGNRRAQAAAPEEHAQSSASGPGSGEAGEQQSASAQRDSNPSSNEALSASAQRLVSRESFSSHEEAAAGYPYAAGEEEEPYLLTATPYRTLQWLFALVPITSLLTILALISLLLGVSSWVPDSRSSFTSYLGSFVFAAAAWVVTFSLRLPLYQLSSLACCLTPALSPLFSTLVQAFCEEVLRLLVVILERLYLQDELRPSDPTFMRLWVLAMGWGAADVVVSVWQGYEQLALYKEMLTPFHDFSLPAPLSSRDRWPSGDDTAGVQSNTLGNTHLADDPEDFMQKEIEQLVRARARLEIEEVYGVPIPNIPVFISCLQRIDSIILSLALFLHISASYLPNVSSESDHAQAIKATIPAFLAIVALHTCLSFIWSANILPRIGVHTASYTALVLSLGTLFAGLGRWDAI